MVFFSKSNLKGTGLFILQELVKSRVEIFKVAKQVFGNKNTWIKEGKIYVKVGEITLCVNSKEVVTRHLKV